VTALDTLKERVAALPRPLLLGLDVDGTLAPIVDDPDRARVPDATQTVLRELARHADYRVALITGRDLPALERMAQVPGAWRAVEHGGWIVAPGDEGAERPLDPADREKLEAFAAWAADGPGQVERKARSVGLHVRKLDAGEGEARLAAAEERAEALGLIARRGRAVLEAELESGDKGRALAELQERIGAASVFFAGDDLTDLPAIRYAAERGVGVFIASDERPEGPEGATLALDGPEDLASFLASLR